MVWSGVIFIVLILHITSPVRTEYSLMSGDVIVAGMFDIYNSQNGACSTIIPFSVKYLEAVKWTLEMLNEKDYVPGVKIGLQSWPTCGMVSTSNDRAIDLINRIWAEKVDKIYQTPPVVGLIGPEHSAEAGNTSLLLSSQRTTDRLVQVGFSTTAASLSNKELYQNFYRVVPGDQIQVEVMLALLKKMEWNYIVVIYDMDAYGTEGYKALSQRATEENICIISSFPIPITNNVVSVSTVRGFLDKTIKLSVSGVIVISTAPHIKVLLSAAQALSAENSDQITFLFSEGLELSTVSMQESSGNVYSTAKGSYTVTPPHVLVDEFEMYWANMFRNVSRVVQESESNKWLRDVYSLYAKDNCFPSNDSTKPGCNELDQSKIKLLSEESLYTSYAIQATYVMAKLIKDTHILKCSGQRGFCGAMKTTLYEEKGFMLERIRQTTFSFKDEFSFLPNVLRNITLSYVDGNGIEDKAGYKVYHYRACADDVTAFCFVKIGNYQNSVLEIDTSLLRDYHKNVNGNRWPNVNRAQCPIGTSCKSCVKNDISDDVFYQDGDVMVCGILPVHNKDNQDPLTCGQIRTSLGLELGEAMAYAVSVVNKKSGLYKDFFPGKKIGFAIINSCNQPLVTQNKLVEMLQKGVLLKNGSYTPVAKKLLGCVGAYGSGISVASSQVLSQFAINQISYASTAALLSDRTVYPYFMRTCTPDDKQAKAMIRIIGKLNSNFIQVVYTDDTYGVGGRDAIRKEAKLAKICIKNEIAVQEGELYQAILEKLRVNSFAKIVIIFVRSHIIDQVTAALNDRMEYGEFMFIGSEAWGYRPDEFQTRKKLVGSITLALQMAESDNFTSYLRNLDILSNNLDPWIKTYAENKYNCYFSTSFDKSKGSLCDISLNIAGIKQDIWTPFALNAMLVLLAGTNSAFNELCGPNSPTVCDQYYRNPLSVRNQIINQTLDIFGDGNPVPVFDNNGDGNVGYRIYNVRRNKQDANVLVYIQVGQAPLDENNFFFDTTTIVTPDRISLPSICPNDKACRECFPENETSPNTVNTIKEDNKTTSTILGVIVGVLALFVLIIVGVFVYTRCRKVPETDMYMDPVNDNDPYLTLSRDRNDYILTQDNSICFIPATSTVSGDSGISDPSVCM